MTLFKEIAMAMMLLVVSLLAMTMYSSYRSNIRFIEDQLYTNAENTASSLGLAISKTSSGKDLAMAETMINAVFDSGLYEAIVFTDLNGKVLYQRRMPTAIGDVPSWFVSRIELPPAVAKVPVGREWMLVGRLSVEGHRGHAYAQMYDAFKEVLSSFALLSLLAMAGVYILLKIVLRSLQKVREQAEAVIENRFIVHSKLPRTREFRDVVLAMNSLVVKVREIFRHEAEAIARYNRLLYEDQETGFYNRHYFRIKMEEFLEDSDRFSSGYVLAVQIETYDTLHKDLGANEMHRLVLRLRDVILSQTKSVADTIRCRTRESDMMLIFPGFDASGAQAVSEKVLSACRKTECPVNCALVGYRAQARLSKIMAMVDNALMLAAAQEEKQVACYIDEERDIVPALGHDAWMQQIREAMRQERFIVMFQPVQDREGHTVQEGLLLGLRFENNMLNAGEFMPIVRGIGMQSELDRYIIRHLRQYDRPTEITVNLSAEFISQTANLQWLASFEKQWKGRRIAFEISNGTIVKDATAVEMFSHHIKEYGWRFGIDHFTVGTYDLHLLQKLKPSFLKINAKYLLSLLSSENGGGSSSSLFTICRLLDIRLIATGVDSDETAAALKENGIALLQGLRAAKDTGEKI